MADGVGAMRERLTIQKNEWPVLELVSLTRSGTVATAVTRIAHGYNSTDYATIAGADQAGFNGRMKVTVVDANTFTYTVANTVTTPATGHPTAQYWSDAQNGKRANWVNLTPVPIFAELIPLSANERMQLGTAQSIVTVQFRVRVRTDLSPTQRVLWTPRWPVGAKQQTVQVNGIVDWTDPWAAGMRYQIMQCSRVAA